MANEKVLKDLYAYIDAHKDDIIKDLMEVSAIKSVSDATSDVKPFGQGCIDALNHMLKVGDKEGFKTTNFDNYVGSILLDLGKKENIGSWAHLDVVPEGDDWLSDPYTPVIRDGFLFGRGVSDNKSAAIGTLYILKAIRELNIELNHNIELFLGTSEETGMADVIYYVDNYKVPKFSFIPDSGFPGACGEFGRVQYKLVSKNKLSDTVKELFAGSVFNIIPNHAYVVLEDNGSIDTSSIPSDGYKVTKENGTIKIEAFGLSKHAAMPEGSLNAVHQLTKVLASLDGLCKEDKDIFTFLTNVNNDSYGTFLGIDRTDEISGQTVSSGTVLRLVDGTVYLTNDCRHCVSDSNEYIIETLTTNAAKYDFDVDVIITSKPYYIDKDGEIVKTITKTYQDYTGDLESELRIGKGGTYAGKIPNAVATGICVRSEAPDYLKPGHGGAHQPDEFLPINGYIEGIKLFATMLINVDSIL